MRPAPDLDYNRRCALAYLLSTGQLASAEQYNEYLAATDEATHNNNMCRGWHLLNGTEYRGV